MEEYSFSRSFLFYSEAEIDQDLELDFIWAWTEDMYPAAKQE